MRIYSTFVSVESINPFPLVILVVPVRLQVLTYKLHIIVNCVWYTVVDEMGFTKYTKGRYISNELIKRLFWILNMNMSWHLNIDFPVHPTRDRYRESSGSVFHIGKKKEMKEKPANAINLLFVVSLFILIDIYLQNKN